MAAVPEKMKSDRLTWANFFLCALAAVGLHVLLAVLFCKEQNRPPEPESKNRVTILFSGDDPRFSAVAQKIKTEPDPAEFIRGSSFGYSKCPSWKIKPEPELKNELPAVPGKQQTESSEKESIPAERTYADLKIYSAPDIKETAAPQDNRNQKELYPIWRDAFGVVDEVRNALEGYNSTIRINSNAVTAPTVLKIVFNARKNTGKVPAHITLQQSCGDPFLDQYAKKVLQNRITDPAFLKRFNPRYNDRISIYWQPELKAVDESTFPKDMFPGGDK